MRRGQEATVNAMEGNGITDLKKPPNVWALSRTGQG